MTVATTTVKTAVIDQQSNPSLQQLATNGKVTPNEIMLSGIFSFLEEVQGLIDDDNRYFSGNFPLASTFLHGVETAYDQAWPLLMELVALLNKSKGTKRSPSDDEQFLMLSRKLVKAICYAHGMRSVERLEQNKTHISVDGFTAN